MSAEQVKPIGPYSYPDAVYRDYDPRAAQVARRVAELIVSRLPAVSVEHIGSTAVEGCAGKGIVDLMCLYEGEALESVTAALHELGFQNPFPRLPISAERPMFVGSFGLGGSLFQLHLHILSAGGWAEKILRRHCAEFRAYPELREEYMAAKRDIIAAGITEPVQYTREKRRRCLRGLRRAVAAAEAARRGAEES
jgi:GrpB-like predicted nucleotidyltransferase (UPF0157 family)